MRRARMGQEAGFWNESWHRSWQMFGRALPLLILWLLLPGGFLVLIFGLGSVEPLVRRARWPARSQILMFTDTSGLTTTLHISFPQEISADPRLIPAQVVSVQVTQQDESGADEALLVSVESLDDGLALLDGQGRSFPQPARWVVPTDTLTSPLHIHFCLHPASALSSRAVSLQFRVLGGSDAAGQSNEEPQSVSFAVEPAWETGLFRLAGSESGTATVVVALLAALVGFGVQQWVRLAEEEGERRQWREEALAEIESAEIESLKVCLRNGRFDDALERYEEFKERTHPPWQDEVIQERLKMVWRETAPPELQRWVLTRERVAQEAFQEATGQEASSSVEAVGVVVWVYNHLPSALEDALNVLKRFLKPTTIETVGGVLVRDIDGLRLLRNRALTPILEEMRQHSDQKVRDCAAQLLVKQRQPARWVSPWLKVRLPDRPQTAHGVQALELSANPFGPERAEFDPLLGEYGVRPRTFWDRICGPRPVLAFGSPGSGKTAAALLLAYDCGFPPASPREKGAFPVYHVPRFDDLAKIDGRVQLDQIARALAETLLQVMAEDPYLFFEQDPSGRTAIAYLMLWYLGYGVPEDVALHLERAGLERSGAGVSVLREMQRLTGSTSQNIWPDETTLLDLLGKARPFGYTHTHVLMDLGIEPSAARMQAISNSMRSLLERTVHLARKGVYIKAFLPERLRDFLGDDLPAEVVELSWVREDLQEMLETRLAHIGVPSLASIYSDPADLCRDPDRRLVEVADLSPRNLVCLGNRMLAQVKAPPLRPEHLPRGED